MILFVSLICLVIIIILSARAVIELHCTERSCVFVLCFEYYERWLWRIDCYEGHGNSVYQNVSIRQRAFDLFVYVPDLNDIMETIQRILCICWMQNYFTGGFEKSVKWNISIESWSTKPSSCLLTSIEIYQYTSLAVHISSTERHHILISIRDIFLSSHSLNPTYPLKLGKNFWVKHQDNHPNDQQQPLLQAFSKHTQSNSLDPEYVDFARDIQVPEPSQSDLRAIGMPARGRIAPVYRQYSRDWLGQGTSLLHSSAFNKGSAFPAEERKTFKLHGLLPPNIQTLDEQVRRAYEQYSSRQDDLAKNTFMASMKMQSEVLYYRVCWLSFFPPVLTIIMLTGWYAATSRSFQRDVRCDLYTDWRWCYTELLAVISETRRLLFEYYRSGQNWRMSIEFWWWWGCWLYRG